MKVSYKPEDSGGFVLMYDETAVASAVDGSSEPPAMPTFEPSYAPTLQQDPLFESDRQSRIPRGNIVCTLNLQFWSGYLTRAKSLASNRLFASLMDQVLVLKVEQDSEVQYYPNAVVASYKCNVVGQAAEHSFVFQTDNVRNSPP